MRVLTVDFESYYDQDVSLRRMSPAEYLLHRQCEVIGASVRMDDVTLPVPPPNPGSPEWTERARWLDGPDLPKLFAKIDWSKTAVMSHNIGFDGALLAWRFGIVPMLYIDTLGMSRALMPEAKGASLGKALSFIGAPPKGTALAHAMGKTLAMIKADPSYYKEYTAYASRDCDGCFWLFKHLAHGFAGTAGVGTIHKNEQFVLMDMIARMTIVPQFSLDEGVLRNHAATIKAAKAKLLKTLSDHAILDLNNPKGDLMSSDRYADVLRGLGVEPPTKISLKTNKETYAFAKTDPAFAELLEHDDPLVQAVVAARLGFKSTQEETRTERFINISQLVWPPVSDSTVAASLTSRNPRSKFPPTLPRMPFPLRFSGAHTHRYSGDWLLNLQNLGRESELRRALTAPPGYKIVAPDASQIEARVVSWLAGCHKLVTAFENKEDVYSTFATSVYNYPVNKKDHPLERFVGKTAVLGLGYGMGAPKFVLTCWVQSKRKMKIDSVLGKRVVDLYRSEYSEIPTLWKTMESVLHTLSTKDTRALGPLIIDGPNESIILPDGMRLYYKNLRREWRPVPGNPDQKREQWVFDYGRETKYAFGGKLTENVVQALAKIITMNAATRVRRLTGFAHGYIPHLAGQIHDQLVYVVPQEIAEEFRAIVVEEMSRRLDWFASLPLAAEGVIGDNLLEAK